MQKPKTKAVVAILLLTILAFSTGMAVSAQQLAGFYPDISLGDYPTGADYAVKQVGAVYYAVASNGTVIFSGNTASTILNAVADTIQARTDTNQKVVALSGTFQLGASWELHPHMKIVGGTLEATSAISMITSGNSTGAIWDITIDGVTLDGKSVALNGININEDQNAPYGAGTNYIVNNKVKNVVDNGIFVTDDGDTVFNINYNEAIYNIGKSGIKLVASDCEIIGNNAGGAIAGSPDYFAISVSGGFCKISDNYMNNGLYCNGRGMMVSNNLIDSVGQTDANGMRLYECIDSVFCNNVVHIFGDTGNTGATAILLYGSGQHDNVFVNNYIGKASMSGSNNWAVGFIEGEGGDYNTITNMDTRTCTAGIQKVGTNTHIGNSWNAGVWVA